jgi:hypothetical protein
VKDAAVVLWIATMLWLPLLLLAEVLRPRLQYDVRRWSTVFPFGMYAACSFVIGERRGQRRHELRARMGVDRARGVGGRGRRDGPQYGRDRRTLTVRALRWAFTTPAWAARFLAPCRTVRNDTNETVSVLSASAP